MYIADGMSFKMLVALFACSEKHDCDSVKRQSIRRIAIFYLIECLSVSSGVLQLVRCSILPTLRWLEIVTLSLKFLKYFTLNHNYNKILESDWLSPAMI